MKKYAMKFIDVSDRSSNVKIVGYCEQCHKLVIVFQSNPIKAYTYENIPVAVYIELIDAHSIGQYYDRHIKGSYTRDNVVLHMNSYSPTMDEWSADNMHDSFCRCVKPIAAKKSSTTTTKLTLELTKDEINEIRFVESISFDLKIKILNAILDAKGE